MTDQNAAAAGSPSGQPEPGEPAPTLCVACRTPDVVYLGHVPIRVGGASGGAVLLFDNLAEATEKLWQLDVWRCAACGHVAFYDLDHSLPASMQWPRVRPSS